MPVGYLCTAGSWPWTSLMCPRDHNWARLGLSVMLGHIVVVLTLVLHASAGPAQFDPAKVMREAGPVAQRFPDPAVQYSTPGFRPGREDFTSHAEALAFLEALAHGSPRSKFSGYHRAASACPWCC